MKRTKRTTIRSWKQAHALLERWRRELASVEVTLKRPRVVGVVPLDFVSGELIEREGKPTDRFRGHVIYFTNADVTVRRPSGVILVIDNYEVARMSDGKTRFEPV
jgi:hypothetical protein